MVSGEQLQSLAEVSFYSELTDIIHNQKLPQNLKSIHDTTVEEIKKYKTIFCYTHFIEDFFNKFYDHLNEGTVLITHNSDNGIHPPHLKYLEGNKIKNWYCQNKEISHPKLHSIPIGLANSQWDHGNQALISEIKDQNYKKEFLVYKNFDINTNPGRRIQCNNITSSNGIPMSPKTFNAKYWEIISKSCFCISPIGNGVDCHRIWECLFLKTIPIVPNNIAFEDFKHLPILFINDWKEVTVDFLCHKKNEYSSIDWNIEELGINYWKKVICSE